MSVTVGFYAHHQGSGHLYRCREIARHLDADVTIFSSAPGADIVLPLDLPQPQGSQAQGPDSAAQGADSAAQRPNPAAQYADPDAGGTMHWAPLQVSGLTRRMAIVAQWIVEHRPAVFYVDVSVEVAVFIRLMGIPVVTLAMPGHRADPAHQLCYQQAAALIAAWPDTLPVPEHLQRWRHKLHLVGGISRLQPAAEQPRSGVVVLAGRGGVDFLPDRPEWTYLGGSRSVANPLDYLLRAEVVISAAGQNSIADLAVAQAAAVIVPQSRAFDEQHATAAAVAQLGLAVVATEPYDWDAAIAQARSMQPQWSAWQVDGAAQRAAQVIAAHMVSPPSEAAAPGGEQ